MYLFALLKSMFRRANAGMITYLLLNTAIVVVFLGSVQWTGNQIANYVIASVLYIISLMITVSPIGEWIMRVTTGCKKLTGFPQEKRMENIFSAVYSRAKKIYPLLPDDVQIYIKPGDMTVNAFATGRKTICVTEGTLQLQDLEIAATLSHEFGHIAHHDADMLLFIALGNIIVSALFIVARISAAFLAIIFHIAVRDRGCLTAIAYKSFEVMYLLPLWLWTGLSILLLRSSSRNQEYDADEFAYNCGLGRELCYVISPGLSVPQQKGVLSIWSVLSATHPPVQDRIMRLQARGVQFP